MDFPHHPNHQELKEPQQSRLQLQPHNSLRRRMRTRTGCLTCRKRKKKCDETKPICNTCVRLKLECVWPPDIDSLNKDNEKDKDNEKGKNKHKEYDQEKTTPPQSKRVRTNSETSTIPLEKDYKITKFDQSSNSRSPSSIATMHNCNDQGANPQPTPPPFALQSLSTSLPQSSTERNLLHHRNHRLISSSVELAGPSIIPSSFKIRENAVEPDTYQNSSDENNTSAFKIATSTSPSTITTSTGSNTTHKRSNYYLKRIAMQEDCVENESSTNKATTPITTTTGSSTSNIPQILPEPIILPASFETYINLNPNFENQDRKKSKS